MRGFLNGLEVLESRCLLSAVPVAPRAFTHVAPHVPPIVAALSTTSTPTEGGLSLAEYVKQKFTAKLGEVTVKVVDLALAADIDWGDGTHSVGTLDGSYE